jgi:hypothetical protein
MAEAALHYFFYIFLLFFNYINTNINIDIVGN